MGPASAALLGLKSEVVKKQQNSMPKLLMDRAKPAQTSATPFWIDKQASSLRRNAAQQLGKESRELPIRSSHWASYADHLPIAEGSLAFNEEVTLKALDVALAEDDPYLVSFLSSKIVEQTYYNIHQDGALKPTRNLTVAKRYGVFFTPPSIALQMAEQATGAMVLDPCCGGGALLAARMLVAPNQHADLLGIELDPFIAHCSTAILKRVKQLTGYRGNVDVKIGDGLHHMLALLEEQHLRLHVLINPPYGRLRVTASSLTNNETALINGGKDLKNMLHRQMVQDVQKMRGLFPSETGILELSRLFFRLCAEISSRGGAATIISPDAWLSNKDSTDLRHFLVKERLIESISLVKEGAGDFSTVNQALAITSISNQKKEKFLLNNWGAKTTFEVNYDSLREREHLPFIKISGRSVELYKKLSCYPKIKDLKEVKNARGEFDQTSAKYAFVVEPTSMPLVRGEHITRFCFNHTSTHQKPSFVNNEIFKADFSSKPKARDAERPRIVGRQCSYAQQSRRLIFCIVPRGVAVGNSCNYLSVDFEENDSRLKEMLGILNSAVAEWIFRAGNSNNHVANYEIDKLPVPTNSRWMPLIAACVDALERDLSYIKQSQDWRHDLLEAAVASAYELDEDEIALIFQDITDCDTSRILNYARQLRRSSLKITPGVRNGFFNNQDPTLSALDRLIISHVPQGGNWQNIPDSVPSERLKQIREMSAERGIVRTTYYGRLRSDQPCYTINTYFNRPGNGTHIHPEKDRTLTSREAARLQSFPDSFLFCGSETAIRNQIGNAVPPLLAYAIGKKFLPYSDEQTCIDLFCGAGGFSLGLEQAGWNIVAAVDNDRDALDTYALNHRNCNWGPEVENERQTAVLQRDLSDGLGFEGILEELKGALNGRSLDLLVGGPPCQGFSHAGFRQQNDARNDLASLYLHFAAKLHPKIFLLENVEGLATFRGGRVLAEICLTLQELGYRVHHPVWKLNAEQYGVPQMRRRVFVVATRSDAVDLAPPPAMYAKCEGRRAARTDFFDSCLDEPFTVADALAGLSLPRPENSSYLLDWLTK